MPPENETPAIVAPAAPEVSTAPVDEAAALRATLVAAADAAANGEPDKPAKPAAAKVDPAATEAAPVAESKVAAVLRAREQAQAAREERATVQAETEKARAEIAALRVETEKMQAEAKAELARLHKLKSAPLDAIKEIGWDRARLIDEVAREGTPEWQAQKRHEAEIDAIRAETAELKAWREEQKSAAAKDAQERQAYGRQQVEKQFLAAFPAESAARALYDEGELVAKGHAIADAYREKTQGKVASIEEVRDYLEEQAVKRLANIRDQQGGLASSQAPAFAAKVVTQPKTTGPRALSGNAASERRTSPKPRHEWTPDEEYSALKAAAEAAMK